MQVFCPARWVSAVQSREMGMIAINPHTHTHTHENINSIFISFCQCFCFLFFHIIILLIICISRWLLFVCSCLLYKCSSLCLATIIITICSDRIHTSIWNRSEKKENSKWFKRPCTDWAHIVITYIVYALICLIYEKIFYWPSLFQSIRSGGKNALLKQWKNTE